MSVVLAGCGLQGQRFCAQTAAALRAAGQRAWSPQARVTRCGPDNAGQRAVADVGGVAVPFGAEQGEGADRCGFGRVVALGVEEGEGIGEPRMVAAAACWAWLSWVNSGSAKEKAPMLGS
jgi:hypothetical protein